MKINNIILAAGGTGGHIVLAQATNNLLKKHNIKATLICDSRSKVFIQGSLSDIERHCIATLRLDKGGLNKIFGLYHLTISLFKITYIYIKLKPKCIIGFGGYPAFPSMLVAALMRIPILIYEPNAVIGRLNKLFLPLAKKVLLALPKVLGINEKYKHKVKVIGVVIREEFLKINVKPKNNKSFTILVIGGSQGAEVFSNVIPQALEMLQKRITISFHILQQVRQNLINETRTFYKRLNIKAKVDSFFYDIDELYPQADLVICRAGASTIFELINFKVPAILIPLPHAIDNHQYYNALTLSKVNAGVIINQSDFTSFKLAAQLQKLIKNKSELISMKEGYKQLNLKNGVKELLDEIKTLYNS